MKILITEEINQVGIDMLMAENFDVVLAKGSEETIKNEISDADAILVRIFPLKKDILKGAKNLKLISKHGAGVDNIDLDFCKENNIKVTRTPGSNSLSVAEHAFMLMMTLAKNLKIIAEGYKNQGFKVKYMYKGNELTNKTLGIIGLGSIGEKLVYLTKGFNMKLLAYDPFSYRKVDNVEFVENLDEILERSDFISIHCALTEDTRNLFTYREFKKMKESAIIVNCARGGIIKEDDLVSALKDGSIRAAALDVTEEEPLDKTSELFTLDNLIVTPHSAVSTEEASFNVSRDAASNVIDFYKNINL